MLFVKMQLSVVLFCELGGILSQACPLPYPLARSLEMLFHKLKRKVCQDSEPVPLTSLLSVFLYCIVYVRETVRQSGNPIEFIIGRLELCP